MFIVEVQPNLYFHYFVQGRMIIGHKKYAKKMNLDEIKQNGLDSFKREVV